MIRLAQEIENLYCVFILTRQSANVFEKDFVAWAVKLRAMTTSDELEEFIQTVLIPKRHALGSDFAFSLRNLREENLPKAPRRQARRGAAPSFRPSPPP